MSFEKQIQENNQQNNEGRYWYGFLLSSTNTSSSLGPCLKVGCVPLIEVDHVYPVILPVLILF